MPGDPQNLQTGEPEFFCLYCGVGFNKLCCSPVRGHDKQSVKDMVLIPVAVLVLLLVLIFYAAWWEAYKKK